MVPTDSETRGCRTDRAQAGYGTARDSQDAAKALPVEEFEPALRCASGVWPEWQRTALASIIYRMEAEQWWPIEPLSVDTLRRRLNDAPLPRGAAGWIVRRENGEAMAAATCIPNRGARPESASVLVYVSPEARGRGIGRALVSEVAAFAREAGCTSYEVATSSVTPVGQKWLERMEARPIVEGVVHQAHVDELDWATLKELVAETNPQGFTVRTSSTGYDACELEAIANLRSLVDEAWVRRRGDQDIRQQVTLLQREEARLQRCGIERWTSVACDSDSGEICGLIEYLWDSELPMVLDSELVAVAPHKRGIGLGRVLKAALLTAVVKSRQSVRYVRATNCSTALGMLETNRSLGYRIHHRFIRWSIQAERVHRYLVGSVDVSSKYRSRS